MISPLLKQPGEARPAGPQSKEKLPSIPDVCKRSVKTRYQYDLGYTPDRGDLTGYHKIHLAMKQKDLAVQAKDGYYADR